MLAFLLPLASKIIKDAVNQIPENEELGEKMVEICLVILGKGFDQDRHGRSTFRLLVKQSLPAR